MDRSSHTVGYLQQDLLKIVYKAHQVGSTWPALSFKIQLKIDPMQWVALLFFPTFLYLMHLGLFFFDSYRCWDSRLIWFLDQSSL